VACSKIISINSNPLINHSRQATLSIRKRQIGNVFRQVHTPLHGRSPLRLSHRYGPPRLMGQRPHAFVDRPKTLTSSTDPRLGASSRHKKLHRYALWQIFSPAFRIGGLTRILHHSILYIIIA